jgi:hypothetical protein
LGSVQYTHSTGSHNGKAEKNIHNGTRYIHIAEQDRQYRKVKQVVNRKGRTSGPAKRAAQNRSGRIGLRNETGRIEQAEQEKQTGKAEQDWQKEIVRTELSGKDYQNRASGLYWRHSERTILNRL